MIGTVKIEYKLLSLDDYNWTRSDYLDISGFFHIALVLCTEKIKREISHVYDARGVDEDII